MGKWHIIFLIIQNFVVGELIHQNDGLLDVGDTVANPVVEPNTPNAEHDFMRNAVKIIQIEAIAELEQTIKDLTQENDEKERQIEQIKKDKVYEITRLKEDFERKFDEKSDEKNVLVKKLNDKTTLANYLMILITKSQEVYDAKKDLIKNHAQDMNDLQTELGGCQQSNIDNLKIVFDSQQTIFQQKESIGRMEKLIELEKNLSKSKEDISKSECNTASWIESLTKAYNEQQEKIDELTLFIEDKDKMEGHMKNIQASLSKINRTDLIEECNILPKNQQLILRQSDSISMLSTLASYAVNSTSSLQFKQDDNGILISATKCNCLPEPLSVAGLNPDSIKYECENWANPIVHLNCEDGSCSNNYWPKCVKTEEDVFEWSSWVADERDGVRKRTSKKVANIYQRERKGNLIYTNDGYSFYKVPVAYGTTLVEGTVAETCKENGMMAVCFGESGCKFNSAQCLLTSLKPESCSSGTVNAISKIICNGSEATTCSKTDGMFVYMNNWSNGADCGNVKGTHCADGKLYESQQETPYYAFCVL